VRREGPCDALADRPPWGVGSAVVPPPPPPPQCTSARGDGGTAAAATEPACSPVVVHGAAAHVRGAVADGHLRGTCKGGGELVVRTRELHHPPPPPPVAMPHSRMLPPPRWPRTCAAGRCLLGHRCTHTHTGEGGGGCGQQPKGWRREWASATITQARASPTPVPSARQGGPAITTAHAGAVGACGGPPGSAVAAGAAAGKRAQVQPRCRPGRSWLDLVQPAVAAHAGAVGARVGPPGGAVAAGAAAGGALDLEALLAVVAAAAMRDWRWGGRASG
jgi:hypothetical protein